MNGRNVELLEKVMQHIEDHPEQHDQLRWCGTAQCFAGWAAHFSGYTNIRFHGMQNERFDDSGDIVVTSEIAADALGINRDTAKTLFEASNTRPMLRLMVKDLINGEQLRDHDEYRREAREEVAWW